jgi:hypothetical protein
MKKILAIVILFVIAPLPAESDEGPRTGYFQVKLTPLELLGEEGARAISSVFPPNDSLTWQLSVPKSYDPTRPAGAMIFVSWSNWGNGNKEWNPVFAAHNMIWIGLVGAGDKKPINERILKAILAPAVLSREYNINPNRVYLFGYSGGAHIASMLATSKPETFKGALFYAGALGWGENLPPKIDVVRNNRYVFMTGSLDDDRRAIGRVAESYRDAGVADVEFVVIANVNRSALGASYLETALEFLDRR